MERKEINIDGYEGLYYIYEDGSIYSNRKRKFLKQAFTGQYYKYCNVFLTPNEGKGRWFKVHRLVAMHYLYSPINDKMEVNHIDMDKENNHYSNLEWCTHQENILKAIKLKGVWSVGRNTGFNISESTKRKMSERKKKKVLLTSDNEEFVLASIGEASDFLNTYREKVSRYVNTSKTINGFSLRLL